MQIGAPGISFPPLLAPLMCVTESSMSRATRNSRLWDGGREDFYREVRLRKERPQTKPATTRESILFLLANGDRPWPKMKTFNPRSRSPQENERRECRRKVQSAILLTGRAGAAFFLGFVHAPYDTRI